MSTDTQLEGQSLEPASVVSGVVIPKAVCCLAPYMSSWWTWSRALALLSQRGQPGMDRLTALSGGPPGRVAGWPMDLHRESSVPVTSRELVLTD